MAPRATATPDRSTGPPPRPSMTATPASPTSAPSTAIRRGRCRSIPQAKSIITRAEVDISVAARLEGSRWPAM